MKTKMCALLVSTVILGIGTSQVVMSQVAPKGCPATSVEAAKANSGLTLQVGTPQSSNNGLYYAQINGGENNSASCQYFDYTGFGYQAPANARIQPPDSSSFWRQEGGGYGCNNSNGCPFVVHRLP